MGRKRVVTQVAGSRYWRESQAQVMVDAWHASGETIAAFAARQGIDARRLGRWVRRLGTSAECGVRFHAVRVTGRPANGEAGAPIEIEMSDGRRVRVAPGFHVEDLRRVLAVLEPGASC